MSHDWTWVDDVSEAKSCCNSDSTDESPDADAAELELAADILASPLCASEGKAEADKLAKTMQTAKTWSIAFGVAFILVSSFAHGWFAWKHADL